MTPFNDLLFFYILTIALIPAVILGLCGKKIKYYGLIITILMLFLIFNRLDKLLYLTGFFVLQYILIKGYIFIRKKTSKRYVLWIFVFISIIPLIYSKILPVLHNSQLAFIGVSYLTFRMVQMLLETYDGLITSVKFIDFAYYILFFPTISSGPIDRSRRFNNDINKDITPVEYRGLLKTGVWKLFTGVFYSLVISNTIYSMWLSKLTGSDFLSIISYMYGYTIFLFFNFAGYSLMAIGTGYILGVRVPENFNMPFLSKDLKDFWSRWHISLSTWFRDYIYTRFVIASLKKKWFKDKHVGSYLGYIITMLTMGIWHGLDLHYIVYGLYHGVLMCVNDILDNNWKTFKQLKKSPKWQPLLIFITFNIICFGLLIFSGKLF